MKKLFSILTLLVFGALIAGLISCNGTTDPINGGSLLPTLTVTGVSASPVEVAPGEVLNFLLDARANANTSKDLTSIEFKATANPGGILKDSVYTPGSSEKKYVSWPVDFTIPSNTADGTTITVNMTVTDKDGQKGEKSWVINVRINVNTYTYTDVILGGQSNLTLGSFYAAGSNLNTVYLIAAAKTNCTKVDMCYYYGSTNAATLAAPNDVDAAAMFTGTYGLAGWAVRNTTKFKKIAALTTTEFDALDATSLQNKFTTGGTEYAYANMLSDNSGSMQPSFVAFRTANPVKYGVLRVSEIDIANQGAGFIRFTVKIMK